MGDARRWEDFGELGNLLAAGAILNGRSRTGAGGRDAHATPRCESRPITAAARV